MLALDSLAGMPAPLQSGLAFRNGAPVQPFRGAFVTSEMLERCRSRIVYGRVP